MKKLPEIRNQTRRFSNHESRLLSRAHTFAIIVILDLKIHQSMWIHWSFFPKTWTKGHWPLHDLWPHVCWGYMCDSTQGSLCPSPMTIHQCTRYVDTVINSANYHIHTHTTCIHTTSYRLHTYYVQNEWSHSLLLNSVQARQKKRGTLGKRGKKLGKKRKKEGKNQERGKQLGKRGKIRKKRQKSGRFFHLPLLTERAGYATVKSMSFFNI